MVYGGYYSFKLSLNIAEICWLTINGFYRHFVAYKKALDRTKNDENGKKNPVDLKKSNKY